MSGKTSGTKFVEMWKPIKIGPVEIKNRFVMAPVCNGIPDHVYIGFVRVVSLVAILTAHPIMCSHGCTTTAK